jgi:16S rRNA (cytosine967-C5)-methyltransferase
MPRRELTPPADARGVAHEVLVRVETTQAFADRLLADRLASSALSPVDQALATTLVYGTLAWQGRLDHHLSGLVRMPLARLDPPVRVALRLGLYQLLFLDRVPAYAAVDASVRLARGAGRGATGLVNAVLRRAAAAGAAGPPLPDAARDPIERLAVEWSHPRWLVERWAATFPPDELAQLLAADNTAPATVVRARPGTVAALRDELAAAGVATTPAAFAPDALVVDRAAARLRALPAYRAGRVAFQGEASQLVTGLLAVVPGARVLDACAAPGGKTAHAAALVGANGLVVALDPRPAGAHRIRAEAQRLGATAARVLVADARRPPLRSGFDAVLVDAPCSGLGTLRRHPELRWRRRPEDVARLAVLQREILTGIASLVRPGGVLVYAVCTLTREENEDVVRALLAAEPRFVLESAGALAPAAVVDAGGFLRTLPHRHGLDGFFAARLRAAG